LGHIYTHKALLEQIEKREVSVEEAGANWYDNIYRPALTLIRKYDIMQYMPERTEADLYLWLVEHLREVREQYGEEASARKLSHALVDFLEDRKLPVPEDLYYENDKTMEISRSALDRAMEEARRREAASAESDRIRAQNGRQLQSFDDEE
jgi:predicted DNA-binding protein (UPF0251 family)